MVVRAGGYFGLPFKCYCGVTQEYPLSPTLSNVVLGAIIRHWVTLVLPTVYGLEVHGLLVG